MAADLLPLAVSAAPILRALARPEPWPTQAALAEAAGRDKRNLPRDLKGLEAAGLIAPADGPVPTLSAFGRAQLAMLERAEGAGSPGEALPPGHVLVRHADLYPDPDNRTIDPDDPDLDDLADSIRDNGLLQNLVVRPPDPDGRRMLTIGERRWRAIGKLIARSASLPAEALAKEGWPAERLILCREFVGSRADYAIVQLIENLQRKQLDPLEEAEAFERLVSVHGLTRVEVGQRAGYSDTLVRQRLDLLRLTDDEKARLRAGALKVEDARRLAAARKPNPRLTPRQWLILLETLDRCLAKPVAQKDWEDGLACQVGPAAAEDEDADALRGCAYLKHPRQIRDQDGDETGHWLGGVQSYGLTQLRLKFGEAVETDAAARAEALSALQVQVCRDEDCELAGSNDWLTPWLNPPFKLSDEVAALLAERKTANAQQREANRAEVARRDAERAEAAVVRRQAEAEEPRLLRALLDIEADGLDPANLANYLHEAGMAGPFTVEANSFNDAQLLQAGEDPLEGYTEQGCDLRRRLVALALNAVLGHPLTSGPPLEIYEDDDEDPSSPTMGEVSPKATEGAEPQAATDQDIDMDSAPAPAPTTGPADAETPAAPDAGAGGGVGVEPPTAAARVAADFEEDAIPPYLARLAGGASDGVR